MNFSYRLSLGLLLFVYCLIGTGCSETRLNLMMKKDVPPIDRSVVSPKLKEKKFTKIIIIPPPGTVRDALEPKSMLFEREFLRLGATVISPAITGRVIMDSTDKPNAKKVEAAADLSDIERALIMANATGAEAILQLIDFKWYFPQEMTRYFIGEMKDESNFREVSYEEWFSWPGQKRHFLSPTLIFAGRVLNVSNGEAVALFNISMPANYTLPNDYRARYIYDLVDDRLTKSKLIAEYTFRYDGGSWLQGAMERTETKVIEYVAAQIIAIPAAGESSPVATVAKEPFENLPKKLPAVTAKIKMPATPPVSKTAKKPYSIQIMAFRDGTAAKKFTAKMRGKLPDIRWVKTMSKKNGVWYHVLIGAFSTKSEAARYREEKGISISKLYPDSFIPKILPPYRGKP